MIETEQCVVFVSHPRSGTHLSIDFVRRNFPKFRRKLRLYVSSRLLYLDLDDESFDDRLKEFATRPFSACVMVKTHFLGRSPSFWDKLHRQVKAERWYHIYPFRRFSKTIKSFAEFSNFRGNLRQFLDQRDGYFGTQETVKDCARRHAESWLDHNASFLDVDALLAFPDRSCRQLADCLGSECATLQRRLPKQKVFAGKAAEAIERIRGRESTEVQVKFKTQWSSEAERTFVDEQFVELYGRMLQRAVNPVQMLGSEEAALRVPTDAAAPR
jgi:hypothetical protein